MEADPDLLGQVGDPLGTHPQVVAAHAGSLADDDDHHARLRDTLRVFLQENGSYKATASTPPTTQSDGL